MDNRVLCVFDKIPVTSISVPEVRILHLKRLFTVEKYNGLAVHLNALAERGCRFTITRNEIYLVIPGGAKISFEEQSPAKIQAFFAEHGPYRNLLQGHGISNCPNKYCWTPKCVVVAIATSDDKCPFCKFALYETAGPPKKGAKRRCRICTECKRVNQEKSNKCFRCESNTVPSIILIR